jgi:hypothetical protein
MGKRNADICGSQAGCEQQQKKRQYERAEEAQKKSGRAVRPCPILNFGYSKRLFFRIFILLEIKSLKCNP